MAMSCTNAEKANKQIVESTLGKQLSTIGYTKLFLQGSKSQAKELWKNGENQNKLLEITQSKTENLRSVFLAAEVLRKYQVPPESMTHERLILAYVEALRHSSVSAESPYDLTANLWGLLYEEDDPGYLGMQVIAFGEAAVPPLLDLLEDEGTVLYEGSEEAFIGNAYGYRIKDFAAFYLSKIKAIPVTYHQELEARDQEIEALKLALK